MKFLQSALLLLVGLGLLVAYSSIFIVNEWERALLLQFGEIKAKDFSPGLHFKIPVLQQVKKFDGRILTLDAPPEPYLTSEKKNVKVDSFIKWRITDTEFFYTAMGGDEYNAKSRISQIINSGLRDEFGKHTIQETISGEKEGEDRADTKKPAGEGDISIREEIMQNIGKFANSELKQFGIGITDFRIKRIDLPENVSDSVYRRMESERKRVAKEFRSKGAEEAERIRAKADRQVEVIKAKAFRDAEAVRGIGDGKSSEIYAKAYKKNPEFYAFWRSLTAYRNSFANKSDILVIEPKNEFFEYFHDTKKLQGK